MGNLGGILIPKLAPSPLHRKLGQIVLVPTFHIISHIQEELGGYFMQLQITHVHNPDPIHTVIVGHLHLLPNLRVGGGIDPAVRFWSTNIVKVVVHTEATGMVALFPVGKHSDVAEVVVGKENGDIVRHIKARFVQILYLFVQSPGLGYFSNIGVDFLSQNAALFGDNVFHRLHHFFHCAVVHHGLIPIAPHTHRHNNFVVLGQFNTVGPELEQALFVGAVVPLTTTKASPLAPRSHHGLVVGSANENSVLIGPLQVKGIIPEKTLGTPHGRPKEVAPEAQDQFKDLLIEFMVETAKPLNPGGQAWGLIIQKDAPVLNGRLTLFVNAVCDN